MNRIEKKIRRDQMRAYKAEGHTHKEVAEKFGVTVGYSASICSGIAPQKADYKRVKGPNKMGHNQYGSTEDIASRLKRAQKYFSKNAIGFEYVGGFTGIDAPVTMKHTACGTVFQITMVAIRHEHIRCPECTRREAEERRALREAERQQAQEQKKQQRAERKAREEQERIEREAARWHACPVCGTLTNRDKYCSDKCRNRIHDRNKAIRRRIKTQGTGADKDITLKKIYELEHGICYLCGRKCKWTDGKWQDGVFIVGKTYPTIEHRIPLSRGGTHTWDNVRLACHQCNSQKGTHSPLSFF